jgi:hypothetical protein
MGCATCYQVFEDLVEQATAELHGARFSQAPPLTPPRNTNSGSDAAAAPSAPVALPDSVAQADQHG